MLPVIDEVRPRYEIEGNDTPSGSALLCSGEITVPDPGPDLSWSYGESPYNSGDGQLTPRNPTSASSSPSLPDSPQNPNVEHEPDDEKQIERSVS